MQTQQDEFERCGIVEFVRGDDLCGNIRVAQRTADAQAAFPQQGGACRTHQEAYVDTGLSETATEISAGAAGAEHEQPHQLRSPTPFFNSHRPSAPSPNTNASINT